MTERVPLQRGLFEEELKDTRTRKQKKRARQASLPQPTPMFSQREVAQFGISARPQMPAIVRNGKPLGMALQIEDPRTEEEKERDRQKEAEKKTYRLISDGGPEKTTPPTVAEIIEHHHKAMEQLAALTDQSRIWYPTAQLAPGPDGQTRPPRMPEEMGETHHIFGPGFHLQRSIQISPLPLVEEI